MHFPQPTVDAAAAIEGVAQELDGLGLSASAEMLRHALDVVLGVPASDVLPPPDESTKRIVDAAMNRFRGLIAESRR